MISLAQISLHGPIAAGLHRSGPPLAEQFPFGEGRLRGARVASRHKRDTVGHDTTTARREESHLSTEEEDHTELIIFRGSGGIAFQDRGDLCWSTGLHC